MEALRKKEDDKKVKRRQKMVENMGDWEKGDELYRIVGMKKVKETGQVMCRCQWKKRPNGDFPLESYQRAETLVERDPDSLIEFFKFECKMHGDLPEIAFGAYVLYRDAVSGVTTEIIEEYAKKASLIEKGDIEDKR
jgi:hypothetical protein